MSDFKQAIEWLKEGKKVRRRSINNKHWYIFLSEKKGEQGFVHLHHTNNFEPKLWSQSIGMLEATDWEIYEEEKSMDRKRLYSGQPQTDYGERGKTEVKGLTMRDIRDCYTRAVIISAPEDSGIKEELYKEAIKGEQANLTENDLFGFNLDRLDPVAIAQNMMCEIEKMMGIFPNIPNANEEINAREHGEVGNN